MSDRRATPDRSLQERGFTLIEILIVVTVMGFLSATLAAVFTVMVRTTPGADERINDARSLKGLVTWLPQDMDATPPAGFDNDVNAWPCGGDKPVDSHNVIAMSWREEGDIPSRFDVSYRYELNEGEWIVARYSCQDGDVGTRVNMTSALAPWNPASPPARVVMCSSPIDATTGACPAASRVTDPNTQPVESMKVTLTLIDGRTYSIDAASKNPDQDLKDDPDAVTNYPPVAGVSNYSMSMVAGTTSIPLDLYATHIISDPEVDYLTSAVDSYKPLPTGIGVTSADSLKATIQADSSLAPGVLSPPVSLIVSDAYGGSVEITITITIVIPPNAPPVATTSPYTLAISAGESINVPLGLSHGVSDPNGDALTLDVRSWPASIVDKPTVGPLGTLQMLVTVKSGVAVGPVVEPIVTRVTDSRGAWIDVVTVLDVVPPPPPNSPPVVTAFASPAATIAPGASVKLTVNASDPDGDLLQSVPGASIPAGLTVTTSGLVVTITADPTIVPGTYAVPLVVSDWSGSSVSVSANILIVEPKSPPSSCVLGGLTANRTSVGRSGPGNAAKKLAQDVFVTLTYSGSCDGLVLKYDTGDQSGLGSGVGRVFPSGSPTTIQLRGTGSDGSEKWTTGPHVLTASTTSAVSPNSVSMTLTVT